MTNCKPGDVVVCIASPAFPEFIGRIFTVTKRCDTYPDSWDTDPPQFVAPYRKPCSFMDNTLRPIRNQPGNDETLDWAPVPTKETI